MATSLEPRVMQFATETKLDVSVQTWLIKTGLVTVEESQNCLRRGILRRPVHRRGVQGRRHGIGYDVAPPV